MAELFSWRIGMKISLKVPTYSAVKTLTEASAAAAAKCTAAAVAFHYLLLGLLGKCGRAM